MIFLNILSWLVVTIYIGVFASIILWALRIFEKKVPFSFVPYSKLEEIFQTLDLKKDSRVYDLGCRDGRTLFYFSKLIPEAKYIGIDDNLFSFIMFKVNKILNRTKVGNVLILREDFFESDLSSASHIFVHLYPNIMDDLLPKFDRELKRGTQLVSLNFHFTTKLLKK
jgi:SAM-dependent methyltransferase